MANNTSSVVGGIAEPRSSTTNRKRRRWLRSDMVLAFLVILPSIIAVAVFIYGFIGWTFYISTTDWKSSVPDYTFVGLKNWTRLINDRRFQMDLRNHLFYAIGFMSQCIVIGFTLASLLDQKIKGEAVFRTLFIFPFAVSGIVTGVTWQWLMQPATGINLLFASIGMGWFRPNWYANTDYGIWAVSIAAAWQFSGYVMALYLAGLRGIPNELREAAAIDGAGPWAVYRYIIIPLLMPVTFTVVVLTGMNSIRVFDIIAALGGPGPGNSIDSLALNMFQTTFGAYRFSLGAAISSVMLILALFLVIPYLMSMQQEAER
ncbi:MAG: sugar ABC transporter permease [Caldilineaceae bacterium]